MGIGRIIMNLRKDKKWSQMQLATKAGISQVMIGKYERGDSMPGFDAAQKIANALEVNLLTLAGEEMSEEQKISKDLVNRMKEVQHLDNSTQSILMNVIDTYIRDYNARKPYL